MPPPNGLHPLAAHRGLLDLGDDQAAEEVADFIAKAASVSSTSGQPCRIRWLVFSSLGEAVTASFQVLSE